MQGEPVHEVAGGLPCLAAAVAWLCCRVRHTLDSGAVDGPTPASHVLFVGEVVDAGERAAEPTTDHPGLLRMEDTRMNYGG
jgi:flavin reductase (DIM6/NTAB) family NADH-FMN oxidoreductase RutF